jgi:GntR family transcriptional regulator, arabinose operon transcriptional repressor
MQDQQGENPRIDLDSSEPSYRQMARILAEHIATHRYGPGQKMPQERELSEAYGISRVTVRNALRILETQGLINRVRGKGTFVAAMETGTPWFSTVPVVKILQTSSLPGAAPEPEDSYYGQIHVGVRQIARLLGLNVQLEAVSGYVRVPLTEYRPPNASEVGGVILCGTFDDQYIRMFHSEGVPMVVVDYWTHDMQTDCVAVDVEGEAHAAIEHLAERGHTTLGFVASGRQERGTQLWGFDPDVRRLLDSLRRVAQTRRLEMRDEWIVLAPTRSQLEQSVRELLLLRSRPTSLFCFDDGGAVPILRMAAQGILRCPEDVSVISRGSEYVEGHQVTGFMGVPLLLGRQAMKLLVERIRGQRQYAVKLAVPTRFVRGTTTGPAPNPA